MDALSVRFGPATRRAALACVMLLACAAAQAQTDAGWLPSGDTQLRLDLQLLSDADVIRLPLSHWPLPRGAVQYALSNAKEHFASSTAVAAALERVRARVAPAARRLAFDGSIRGGDPGLWRDFDTLAREQGELSAGLDYDSGRFSLGVELTGVADPDDGDNLRADGSQASVRLGNWLLSLNELDRWWGPAHEGSLILSNNARPMPTAMVERVEPRPFETRWLNWLGPWRFSFGISQMENNRVDIDRPLFMAWRVVVMPFNAFELGFSRTAQFCGKQLECNLDVFGNLLAGNDNVGIDATAADEPGNQMAGFDLRWNSPIGHLPYAIYGQYIGEDESSYLPSKYLSQLGLEVWKPFPSGAIAQVHFEYSSTTCSANSNRGPYYGCAYNQGKFNFEGYRYHGRSVGYTADRDAENWALGLILTASDGELWTGTARRSRLDRGGYSNPVAAVPTDYAALEFGWKGRLFGESVSVDLGVESIEPVTAERKTDAFGFIGWRHDFRP